MKLLTRSERTSLQDKVYFARRIDGLDTKMVDVKAMTQEELIAEGARLDQKEQDTIKARRVAKLAKVKEAVSATYTGRSKELIRSITDAKLEDMSLMMVYDYAEEAIEAELSKLSGYQLLEEARKEGLIE